MKDFTWWSGLSTSDVKVGLEMNRSHLEIAVVDGTIYWLAPNVPATWATSPMAHLLPAYGEYTIAYKEHAIFLDPQYTPTHHCRKRLVSTGMKRESTLLTRRNPYEE
jgi:DNA glycosylase AlkZ-like